MIRSGVVGTLLVMMLAWSAVAQGQVEFSRILVPLVPTFPSPTPGAGGSLWQIENWLSYTGETVISVIPRIAPCVVTCDDLHALLPVLAEPAPFAPYYSGESGVLVSVPTAFLHEVRITSRVRDVSRGEDSGGTEVPVVHESSFASRRIRLVNVPISLDSRTALRIYALPEVANPEVEVRYFRMPHGYDSGVLLKSERRALIRYPPVGDVRLLPSFSMVPNIQSGSEFAGTDSLFIDVIPLTEGLKVWPMTSTTNNTTQQVTIVWPQP